MTDTRDPDGAQPDETIDASADVFAPGIPSKIGPYAIKRVIASGGMGTVYEALQENPRRPVAVKVVRRGMASAEGLKRFEREAQALARLRHPGIAQIYEAGTFEDGDFSLPFFALEYIPNARTITDYATAKNQRTRQRLELFIQVCEAVHYGHQRGIIHRDLKPANILIDSEGRARIIDFGVARAVDADQNEADAQTRFGQIVGTAQYMSPEQFEADPNDLDTRSDIYTLGVVLFELLTGRLPYDFGKSGIFEIARIVREDPALALGAAAPDTDGELALVVAKALDKDRERRYQSAFGLAQDLRRYLRGEAISARTTSFSYQVKVFTRRNKAAVGLAAAAAVLLVGGILWTSSLLVDVSAERTRAETAAERAIAANEFLKTALQSVIPIGFGDIKTIGDLCDKVAEEVDDAFPDDALTEADIRLTIGQIYSALDDREPAEFNLRKAYDQRRELLGRTHEQTMEALEQLYTFYYIFGPNQPYLEAVREAHAVAVLLYGAEDERTIEAYSWVLSGLDRVGSFGEAERESRRYCELVESKWGPDSVELAEIRLDHAKRQLRVGRVDEAVATASRAYRTLEEMENVTASLQEAARNTYAMLLLVSGGIDEAKKLYGNKRPPVFESVESAFQEGSVESAGDIRILVLFESWCPFCQRHMPRMERIHREYRTLGVDVVGLTSVNRSSSDDKVRRFIAENEMTFPVYKESGRVSNFFGSHGVPFTAILHQGEVVMELEGAVRIDRRVIEGLIGAR